MTEKPATPTRALDAGDPLDRVPEPLCALVRSNNRLEKEEVFELLYNPRRRYALQLLVRFDRPLSMDDLVERIAADENDVPVGELERQQRRRVHVSLYQTHLPLLDERDAVEYDRRAERIAPGSAIRELTPYLDTGPVTSIPWRTYYGRLLAGYACLGTLVLAVPIGVSLSTLAIGVSLLFLALASVHGVTSVYGRLTSDVLATN